jgi:hypothetical protein
MNSASAPPSTSVPAPPSTSSAAAYMHRVQLEEQAVPRSWMRCSIQSRPSVRNLDRLLILADVALAADALESLRTEERK